MTTILNDAFFISAKTNRDLVLYKNPFDRTVHVFTFIELNHKTTNTPYYEFTGKDITEELTRLNQHAFASDMFEQRIEKLYTVNLRAAENEWLWIRAQEPHL